MKKSYIIVLLILTTFILLSSACNKVPNNINESTSTPVPVNSYQKYMGTWYSDVDENDLTIWESNNKYKFELGIIRITTINATAEIEGNNKLRFSDTEGPNIKGTLEFKENSILVTIDESDFQYIKAGTTYNFTDHISSDIPSEATSTQ